MENAVIVFVRNPEKGKVKTRLAETMGADNALKIYQKLLQHSHDIIKDLECDKFVFYADEITKDDIWENDLFKKEVQIEGTLGDKMAAAFEKIFLKKYKSVTIIGSDCYELQAKHIENAIASLKYNDVVIGPAADGGYYLLGMNRYFDGIFDLEEWSTPHVFENTLQFCKAKYLQVVILQTLSDVDEEEDVTFSY